MGLGISRGKSLSESAKTGATAFIDGRAGSSLALPPMQLRTLGKVSGTMRRIAPSGRRHVLGRMLLAATGALAAPLLQANRAVTLGLTPVFLDSDIVLVRQIEAHKPSRPDRVWNRIPDAVQGRIIDLALEMPELSPRESAVRFTDQESYFVSEASVYRLLKSRDLLPSPAFIQIKAAEEFHTKTTAPNQLWQTDFTYLKVIGWGWFYLCSVLDDFSRYVIAWRLCTGMTASDVSETLELAMTASGCRDVPLRQRPRLLSDNGPGFISDALAQWLAEHGIQHVRGAPAHPQTQGKIERWHQTMKNRILLENYYLPGALQTEIEEFVEQYSHRRYHESLSNLTPADVYFGSGPTILLERERIKRRTIRHRRLMHHQNAA